MTTHHCRAPVVSPPIVAHPEATTDQPSLLGCPNDEALVGLRWAQQHYTLNDNSVVS